MRGASEGDHLLEVSEAIARVLQAASVLPAERVALAASLGRVLAEDVVADVDVPPFDRCTMDGFALRSADVASVPATLRVIGTAPAGRPFAREVGAGECVRVMTGAPLPAGCDGVEPVEHVEESSDGASIVVARRIPPRQHVAPRAEDLASGAIALVAGTLVGPAHVGMLATVGCAEVVVHARPMAAVVSTGDELVEVGERPGPGQIRNSNGPMLAVLARLLGCDPVHLLPVARDEEASLTRALEHGLASDVLLVSGGVSRGERDLVQDVLPHLGVRQVFHGVSIQPGKPVWFGATDRGLVFALPGNPVSALVTARVLAGPAIRKMRGVREPGPRIVSATLSSPFRRKSGRPGYLPAIVRWTDAGYACEPLSATGSADLVAAAASNAMWIAPKGRDAFEMGDRVDVMLHIDHAER